MTLLTAPIVLELTDGLPESETDSIVVRLAHVDEPGDVRATLGVHFGRRWACDRIVLVAPELTTEAIRFVTLTGSSVFRLTPPSQGNLQELGGLVSAAIQTLETGQALLVLAPSTVRAEWLTSVVRRAMAWRGAWQSAEDSTELVGLPQHVFG
jgi:hypothetical protein